MLDNLRRKLYHYSIQRAVAGLRDDSTLSVTDANLCWIFGAGRSGSTWLLEMLGHLNNTRTWHEPYFGAMFQYLSGHPEEPERGDSFFSNTYSVVWTAGVRRLLLAEAEARFGPVSPETQVIIKDVNTPFVCPFFADFFPRARYMLLLRDPFDVLDSYIDMQRPGGWNKTYVHPKSAQAPEMERIRGSADHIRTLFDLSVGGYQKVAPSLRMEIRYEELLDDPVKSLGQCARFLGLPAEEATLEAAVTAERFEKYQEHGKLAFRRFGKAGIWQTSGNFTPEVTQIAQEILGDLRTRLRYGDTK
ncbi:MAG TPA: sulfotransferase [Chthonomonadaceae bacterium]|nr:sulfotransferase [Chthonomonadaceae bacterium]